jgi:hypothetical protein
MLTKLGITPLLNSSFLAFFKSPAEKRGFFFFSGSHCGAVFALVIAKWLVKVSGSRQIS